MRGMLALAGCAVLIAGCGRRTPVSAGPPPVVVNQPAPQPPPGPPQRSRRVPEPPPQAPREVLEPPVLESMRTPEERRDVIGRITASLGRAEGNLARLRGRQLNADSAREVARVESFIRQARAAMQSNDLMTAREYAQRAEVLSADLLER